MACSRERTAPGFTSRKLVQKGVGLLQFLLEVEGHSHLFVLPLRVSLLVNLPYKAFGILRLKSIGISLVGWGAVSVWAA